MQSLVESKNAKMSCSLISIHDHWLEGKRRLQEVYRKYKPINGLDYTFSPPKLCQWKNNFDCEVLLKFWIFNPIRKIINLPAMVLNEWWWNIPSSKIKEPSYSKLWSECQNHAPLHLHGWGGWWRHSWGTAWGGWLLSWASAALCSLAS